MKFIHKNSDPPTQVRRRADFLKILIKNRRKTIIGTRMKENNFFFAANKILWPYLNFYGSFFKNSLQVMSYESCVIFEYLWIMSHVWVIHMHVAYRTTPNFMKITMVEKFLRSAHANFLKCFFLKMRGRDQNFD